MLNRKERIQGAHTSLSPGKTSLPAAGFGLVLLLLTACGGGRPADPVQPGAAAIGDLDIHRRSDMEFFSRLRRPGALYIRPPADLAAGVKASTAVVIAEVTGDRPTRTPGDGDPQPLIGVVLRPVEVLKGRLRPEPKEAVAEFLGGSTADSADPIAELRRTLPRGKAIWFLRWNGKSPRAAKTGATPLPEVDKQYYSLVHMEGGVFVQGPSGILAPTAQRNHSNPTGPSLRNSREKFQKPSELAHRIRTAT